MVPVCIAIAMIGALQTVRFVERARSRQRQVLNIVYAWRTSTEDVCAQVEKHVSVLMHVPAHILAQAQMQSSKAAEDVVQNMGRLVIGVLDMVRVMVHMVVSSYKALAMCVLQLVVQGVLSLLDAATHAINLAVHDAAQALRTILDTVLQTADGAKDLLMDTVNGVLGLFGHEKIETHAWSEPAALRVLNNISLPASLIDPFKQLRSSLPTVDDLRTDAEEAFLLSISHAKKEVYRTLTQFHMPPPVSLPPAPMPVCQIDWTPLEHATRVWTHTSHSIQALVMCIMAGVTLALFTLVWASTLPQHVDSEAAPWLRRARQWLGSPSFLLASAWLLLQLMLDQVTLMAVQVLDRVSSQALQDILSPMADSAHQIHTHVASTMQHTARHIQTLWQTTEQQVNRDMLGWVNESAPQAHAVLNGIWDLVSGTVHDALGHTPLHDPVQQFAGCVIGNKVNATDHILSWLQTHAYITLPPVIFNTAWPDVDRWIKSAWEHKIPVSPLEQVHTMLAEERKEIEHDRWVVLLIGVGGALSLGICAVISAWI